MQVLKGSAGWWHLCTFAAAPILSTPPAHSTSYPHIAHHLRCTCRALTAQSLSPSPTPSRVPPSLPHARRQACATLLTHTRALLGALKADEDEMWRGVDWAAVGRTACGLEQDAAELLGGQEGGKGGSPEGFYSTFFALGRAMA